MQSLMFREESENMKLNHRDPVYLGFVAAVSLLLTACAQNTGTATAKAPTNARTYNTPSDVAAYIPPAGTGGGAISTNQLNPPLEFVVDGVGNHARHICVPATQTLVARVKANPNYDPLMPLNTTLVNKLNGQLLYDGSPAYYTMLRLRLTIPGSAASWDFGAMINNWSVKGDFSPHLRAVAATTVTQTDYLTVPEYGTEKHIWGSNAYDSMCTYWEQKLGNCSTLSSLLRSSESAVCPAGQQKILITQVVSDYPCQNDGVGWCKGGGAQIVPDYQHWNAVIQVATENTKPLP